MSSCKLVEFSCGTVLWESRRIWSGRVLSNTLCCVEFLVSFAANHVKLLFLTPPFFSEVAEVKCLLCPTPRRQGSLEILLSFCT